MANLAGWPRRHKQSLDAMGSTEGKNETHAVEKLSWIASRKGRRLRLLSKHEKP